ncbi:hypothetical protein ABID95_008046 [Streptomyces atratus]
MRRNADWEGLLRERSIGIRQDAGGRASLIAGQSDTLRDRDIREKMIPIMERYYIQPTIARRLERIHLVFFISSLAITLAVATCIIHSHPASYWKPEQKSVLTQGQTLAIEQFLAASLLATIGPAFHRRRTIWQTFGKGPTGTRTEAVQRQFSPLAKFHGHALFVASTLLSFGAAGVIGLIRTYEGWPTGFAVISPATIIAGYGISRASYALEGQLHRRHRFRTVHSLDVVTLALFELSSLTIAARYTDWYESTNNRMIFRKSIEIWAARIETQPIQIRYTTLRERSLRREIRSFHLRVGAAIRSHSVELAKVREESQYLLIEDSLVRGFINALDGNTEALLENAPELSRSSRVTRVALHCVPAATMVTFALLIPVLPGVGEAAGSSVRVFLLAAAALALIPGSGTAKATVEGALTRVLPGQAKS